MRSGKCMALEGLILRAERRRQKRGQKEICHGICVPSWLSRIEHGNVCPDEDTLAALFARLGIRYERDPQVLDEFGEKIREYFYRLEYHMEPGQVYRELKKADETLRFGRFAIDWQLIRGFEGDETALSVGWEDWREWMSVQQLGRYLLLCYLEKPDTQDGYESCRKACELLGSSYAMVLYCSACLMRGDYAGIHRLENRVAAAAVEEGNTYNLASYYFMKGNACACLNMEKVMMDCYERGLRLLQNTGWKEELRMVYYNIGATYISLKKYDLAVEWLDRAFTEEEMALFPEGRNTGSQGRETGTEGEGSGGKRVVKGLSTEEQFAVLQKKALALARSGKREQAAELLDVAGAWVLQNDACPEADYLKYEEARMECEEGFLSSEAYAALLERLRRVLERDCHFGHLYFYRDVITECYRRQRKYKKALEFEQEISEKMLLTGI